MATYKVIQDIEAEDKILLGMSLRQFIFGLFALLCLYFCYLSLAKGAAFLLAIFLPPALIAGFFAIPFGRDQPTEIWALAKIRFALKPRRRIWDQSGVKELVTVTAPKKVEQKLTDGLSQTEVRSRLSALANTIDSRGWAIKNVNVNMYAQPQQIAPVTSDRLIDMSEMPQQVPDYDVQAADDILDEQNNPIAHQFEELIANSEQTHRQKIQEMMNSPVEQPATPPTPPASNAGQPPDYWFMHEPVTPPKLANDQAMFAPQVQLPSNDASTAATTSDDNTMTPAEEKALAAKLKKQRQDEQKAASFGHMKTIQPIDQQQSSPPPVVPTPATPNPATVLATDNDKSIDVIAREAKRINKQDTSSSDGEVVVNLH